MKAKEAKALIKINKLLEAAGWRFFDTDEGPANIQLEANVKITKKQIDEYGEDFEKVKNGFVDFLLLDEKASRLSSSKQSQRIMILWWEKSRQGSMPSLSSLSMSFFPTAIFTTSGTSTKAIPRSLSLSRPVKALRTAKL